MKITKAHQKALRKIRESLLLFHSKFLEKSLLLLVPTTKQVKKNNPSNTKKKQRI